MAGERWEAVKAWGLRVGMCLAVLPLFYVLSIGLVVRWADQHSQLEAPPPEQVAAIEEFYAPLVFVFDNCPPFATVLGWYVELWRR